MKTRNWIKRTWALALAIALLAAALSACGAKESGTSQAASGDSAAGNQGQGGADDKQGNDGKQDDQTQSGAQTERDDKQGDQTQSEAQAGSDDKQDDQTQSEAQTENDDKAGDKGQAGADDKTGDKGQAGIDDKTGDKGQAETDDKSGDKGQAGTDDKSGDKTQSGKNDKPATPTQDEPQAGADDKNSGTGGGKDVKHEIEVEIEITCPEEYSKRSGSVKYSPVQKKTYYSTTCEKTRRVNIVLPDGYTEDKKYPVLYLLHGIFGHEGDMNGNSVTIQNMMTKGIAEEMIVVYPYMYASKTQNECTAIDETNVAAYDNFINDLVTDLMPFVKENYSVAEGKENTAIAGFSMGGREALAIGLQRPDLFGYVCGIAPAPGLVPGRDWAMYHKGQFKEEEVVFGDEKPFLLMVCSGDNDHTVGTFPKSYHNLFEKNGVEHTWWEIPGSDHGDPAITSGIYNFCKYVFK